MLCNAILTRAGRNFNVLSLTKTWRDADAINADAARKGRTAIVFTCSLSDFFHHQADHWREEAWEVIKRCTHIRWMVLTKRPERIKDSLPLDWGSEGYRNVWLGVTVGCKDSYPRLEVLRAVPCALRFISAEPLLESIADINLDGIGWVATGGMSGSLHKVREMDISWAYELYELCRSKGIPFLFKQASHRFTEHGIYGLSRFIAGERQSDNLPLIRQYPEVEPPLLPFIEFGRRFTNEEWSKVKITPPTVTPGRCRSVILLNDKA